MSNSSPTAPPRARAGYRACLRCEPDEVNREEVALARVYGCCEAARSRRRWRRWRSAVGYSPHHFHRLFKRATGVTPAAYYRSLRAKRAEAALGRRWAGSPTRFTTPVIPAPARFYAEAGGRLGMTPSAWRDGGRGETIRWAVAETDLGAGCWCGDRQGHLAGFRSTKDEGELGRRFPKATVVHGGWRQMSDLVRRTVAAVNAPEKPHDLPLDVQRHRLPGSGAGAS